MTSALFGTGLRFLFLLSCWTLPALGHQLVGLYHLDEGEGDTTYIDSSIAGNNGSCTTTACPTNVEIGKFNSAAFFDGNDHILIPDAANLDNTATLTMSVWFFPTTLSGDPRGLISKRVDQSNGQSYSLYIHTANRIYVDIDKQATDNRFFISNTVQVNRWYHIVVVYNGGLAAANRVNVYFNGNLDSSSPHNEGSATIPNYASALHIGSLNAGYAQDFVGAIDEVAIYRAAIPARGVREMYERGAWRTEAQRDVCGGRFCNFVENAVLAVLDSYLNPHFKEGGKIW